MSYLQLPTTVQQQITSLKLQGAVNAVNVKPPTPAQQAKLPVLHPAIVQALQLQGYKSLYLHQAEAITAATRGEDVILTTPTASGKTLAFQIPMVEAAVTKDGPYRSLYLAPTKSLISDQHGKMLDWVTALARAGQDLKTVVLTGDTPGDRAALFRHAPDVLLTNPDCLNNLLHKTNFSQFRGLVSYLKELRYVVLDEVQSFPGIFGCNVANLIRRLKLAVHRAGGAAEQLQFIVASATVGNPKQVWQTLCGREPEHPVSLIERSSAPFPGRTEIYCNGKISGKAGVCRLMNNLLEQGLTAILFVQSRPLGQKMLHLIRREQKRLGNNPQAVAIFHGTLSPQRRQEVIRNIEAGKLRLIIATSALEQGVDFPQIDAAVCMGFPGINQLRQRFGRAGRGQTPGLGIFIPDLRMSVDQHYARNGQELIDAEPAPVLINPDYLPRLKQHILAAAGESKIHLQSELQRFFGEPGIFAALALKQEGKLTNRNGYLVADLKAALAIPMRGAMIDQIWLVEDGCPDEVIEEFSRALAIKEIYPGAIYSAYVGEDLHKWEVVSLDLELRQAVAIPFNSASAFSTRAFREMQVIPDLAMPTQTRTIWFGEPDLDSTPALGLTLGWGTIQTQVVGYEQELTIMEVACFTPDCKGYGYKLPQREENCPHCGEALQIASSSSETVKQVTFDQPLQESYRSPLLWLELNVAAEDLVKDLAAELRQKLRQAYDQIPDWHRDLVDLPPEILGLHTVGHLLMNALPLASQPLAASDLTLNGGNNLLLFDDADLGTGTVEYLYEQLEQLLASAYHLVTECDCETGCPKCCHTPHCSDDNNATYRPLGQAFLEAVLKQ